MKKKRSVRGLFALIPTLVLATVAASAYLRPPTPQPPAKQPSAPAAPEGGPRILIVGQTGASLVVGTERRALSWPDDVKLLGAPLSTLRGRDPQTGEDAWLDTGFVRATSSGLRSPDGRRSLHPTPSAPDGTGAVIVKFGGDVRTIILREANGRGIRDARAVGWWDDETIAVVGVRQGAQTMFAVGLAGDVRTVAVMPETASRFEIRDGALWVVTLTPGEGLESEPRPPSELHRITKDGTDERVVTDAERVIARIAVRDGALAAYQTEDGRLFQGASSYAISGTLLDPAPDGWVLVSRGPDLVLLQPATGEERLLPRPDEPVLATFILPAATVDENGQTR
ncbi:hypothetical protein HY479_03715 [Candidatus Uhrbacteria bacterium]|nr:hypothetical protein [Candidatus Uhrbacteria bacterium]